MTDLPTKGRALDVAGGAGRNALWLARRGLDVTLVDWAEEGILRAEREAKRRGLTISATLVDLETAPLPGGPWDVILCISYLQRDLFEVFPQLLAPAGLLVVQIATVRNLERNDRPPRPFLLSVGEAPQLVEHLEILSYIERWSEDDQHEARLVARAAI